MENKEKSLFQSTLRSSRMCGRGSWFLRRKVLVCVPVLFIVFLFLCLGCNEVERHRLLTFFFEGVPPVDAVFRPVRIRRTQVGIESSATIGVVDERQARIAQQKRGSQHEPASQCDRCHFGRMGANQGRLAKPIPELCYSCHENHQIEEGNPHGPVTAGACVFCHHPHQSGYVHLQRAAQPDLCYRCHLLADMGTIVDHEDKLDTICTDCHDPHTSSMKKLLKPGVRLAADPNSIDSVGMPQEDPNSVK